MKDEELKDTVKQYAKKTSKSEAALLFEGIVSKSTIYKWCREIEEVPLLSYAYDNKKMSAEWKALRSSSGSYSARPVYNRIVTTYQPHFYKRENELWRDENIRKKLIENRKKYLFKDKFTQRELLRGFKISAIHIGFSHFASLWFKKFIADHNVKVVYDPCGGWGHRLLGAAAAGIDYIYNDKWKDSCQGINQIQKFVDSNYKVYNNDCRTFVPEESYDAVFTCPPYYNVEIYEEAYKTIEEYVSFIRDMLRCSLKSSVNVVGIVINNQYADIIESQMPSAFKLCERHLLGSTNMVNHFNNGKSKKTEELLVFKRV